MKTIFTALAIMLTTILTAQTPVNLSGMTQDMPLGQNCSNSQAQEQFITTGDLNLNGKTLHLRNAYLTVTGYIKGPGRIEGCGNSKICTMNAIQNSPVFNSVEVVNCSTLGVPEFEFDKYGHHFKVFDLTGRLLLEGITDENTFYQLPSMQVFILEVEGFATKKLLKR